MRKTNIDVARGFAIFLVVLGHILLKRDNPCVWLLEFIYSFHMPFFFILSGLFITSHQTLKETIVRKGKSLIYPYFTFSLISIFLQTIKYCLGIIPKEDLQNTLYVFVSFQGFGVLWFLPTLFLGTIFYCLLCKHKISLYLFISIFFPFLCVLGLHPAITNYYASIFFIRVIVATFLIYIGNSVATKTINLPTNWGLSLFATLVIIINIYLCHYNGLVDFHYARFNNILLFLYLSISSSLSILILSNCVNNKLLESWGRDSLIIMVTHYIFPVLSLCLYFGNFVSNTVVSVVIITISVMTIESFLCKFVNSHCLWLIKIKKN